MTAGWSAMNNYQRQRAVLDALWHVESGRRLDVPLGDNGKARGPLQIWEVYWIDAALYDPLVRRLQYVAVDHLWYAMLVVEAYMRRYARHDWFYLDPEVIARMHNGGPRGHTKDATLGYWEKVKAYLKKVYAYGENDHE